ncbi:hypothetical protein BKA61DRAFT_599038 [Leptodontidium sp. MPI-SDFR-AT-0119]|nr:hypothetical protein BKA61DRAFT_599038 [Leptodontidium sp. MPI-SDFR-AT-0119]
MAIMERILIFTINIFFPPLSVLLVAGPGTDCLINTLLFIAGVIPGHIHGFYVTCTYFHRRHKVKRGRYPGGRKAGVYSERVWNGGASNRRVDDLWRAERRVEMEKEEGSRGKRSMRRNQVVVQESVDGNGEGKKWWRH